jgi:hypothetical protein
LGTIKCRKPFLWPVGSGLINGNKSVKIIVMRKDGDFTDGAVAIVNFKYLRGIDLKADLTTVATALVHNHLALRTIHLFVLCRVGDQSALQSTLCLRKDPNPPSFV